MKRTRTPFRKGVVLFLVTVVYIYGYPRIPGYPRIAPAHAAVLPPSTSNPETTRDEVKSCPPMYPGGIAICLGGGPVLKSRIPIEPGDAAGVAALQADATDLVAALHGFDRSDLRVTRWGRRELWGAMYDHLLLIIKKPADQRTPEERGAYNWFQQVVQQYRIKSAKNALDEYNNWKAQQCAYKPGVPSPPLPAYDGGVGCQMLDENQIATNAAALATGAHPPTFDQLQQWGSYKAAQTLGTPNSTASQISGGLAAGLMFAGAAAGVAAGTVTLTNVSAAQLSLLIGGKLTKSEFLALARTGEGLGAVIGAGTAAIGIGVAVATVVLAIVALVTGIVQQFQFAELPKQLQSALDSAQGALPDLTSMLDASTQDGANLLGALFIGQTDIAGGTVATPKPNWHGDLLRSQSMDISGSTPVPSGPVISSKAVSVKSWGGPLDDITKTTPPGGSPPALTWLTDQGWFQQSIKPSTWTTEASIRYLDWDGNKRVALVHGGKFIDMPAGAECQDPAKCQTTSTLEMLDANGTPITVSVDPSVPVPATITMTTADGVNKAGQTTTFTDPEVDSRGLPVTYKWQFEDRCSFCLPPFDPQTGLLDGSFHGHGVVTKTGQTVSYTWPDRGTFHVRLTTTNEAGSQVTDMDVQVARGDAPKIAFGRSALGPILLGEKVLLTGCVTTAASTNPTVSINWGDGTIDQATAPLITLLLNGVVQLPPGQKFLVQPGSPAGGGCTGDWSFVAAHTYSTRSEVGYPVSVTADDGDGQSATANAGTVGFLASELSGDFVVTNATSFNQGMPLFNEGETVKFEARFNADPARYGNTAEIDWGIFGIHTAFFKQCHPDGSGGVQCTIGQTLHASQVFWSKPATGLSVYTPTLTVRDSSGNIKFQKVVQVMIDNLNPTISGLTISPSPTAQGQLATLSGTVSSPDPNTPLAIKITWGGEHDGGIDTVNLPPGRGDRTFRSTHTYREWSTQPRLVSVYVYDDNYGFAARGAEIFVSNVPPSPRVDPVTVDQGSPFALGIVTGDPGLDPFRATIDWGDGSSLETKAYAPTTDPVLKSPTHTYAVPGTYDVNVSLADGPGQPLGQHTASTTVTVNNVSPVVELDSASGDRRTPLTVTGTITDPGTQDAFTGTVDWRDGSAPEPFTRPAGTTSFSLTHTYDQGGVYPVAVKVSDERGGASNEATAEATVNGPPSFRANNPGDAMLGEAIGYQFAAQGFPAPSYALVEGTLPPGLTLGSDGFLFGTPTAPGTYTLKVSASNQYGSQVAGPITMRVHHHRHVSTRDTTPVSATFSLIQETLTVSKAGRGSGMVTSSPAGISCGATCSYGYPHGTSVTLSAKASKGSAFAGWSDACTRQAAPCTLWMSAAQSVQATFLKNCVVPKVKDKSLKAAKRAIKSHDCRVGQIKHAASSKVKKGHVISQKPRPGMQLNHGAKVRLLVSMGKH